MHVEDIFHLGYGLLLLLFAPFFLILLLYLSNTNSDPREPPAIPQPIPYIGHLLGLICHGTQYYAHVSAQYPLDIYTLRMPQGNTYVVNSIDLINSAQRNYKTLSFAPFVATFLKRLCIPSAAASQIVDRNLFAEEGSWGLFTDTHNAMHYSLAPGPDLDDLIASVLWHISQAIEALLEGHDEIKVDLYAWVHHMITLASTDGVYGPQNPFRDPVAMEGFWAVESKFALLFVNVAPDWFAPKAYQGRRHVFEAIYRYYTNKGHESGSVLAKARYHAAEKNGTPLSDIAKFELSGLFGMLVNTVPCTFWMLVDVFSNSRLLNDVRDEISTVIVEKTSIEKGSSKVKTINIGRMKEECPLLRSVFQETLRTRSTGSSIRRVREDFVLADRWLLKKDSTVQMPFPIVHANENLWGDRATEYQPDRFVKSSNKSGTNAIRPGTFRAFGGGTTLCPGRHFATAEITSVVAMMAARFEIRPVDEGKGWKGMKQAKNHGATSVLPPEKDVRVTIKKRKGSKGKKWKFDLERLNTEFVAGDGT